MPVRSLVRSDRFYHAALCFVMAVATAPFALLVVDNDPHVCGWQTFGGAIFILIFFSPIVLPIGLSAGFLGYRIT